jgi:hypothetical protein
MKISVSILKLGGFWSTWKEKGEELRVRFRMVVRVKKEFKDGAFEFPSCAQSLCEEGSRYLTRGKRDFFVV